MMITSGPDTFDIAAQNVVSPKIELDFKKSNKQKLKNIIGGVKVSIDNKSPSEVT